MKMQRKKIEYSGISTSPDDYVSADGQLALSHNMLIEDGGVKAVGEANVVLGHVDGDVVYIHKNPDYDKPHYIIIRGNNKDRLNYVGGDSNDDIVFNGEFKQCSSVGHTLIVLTTKEMLYVIWKDGRYVKLGNALPEISVNFTTQGYFGQNGSLNIDRDSLVVMDSAYYADAEALKAQKAKISIRPLATTLDSLSYNISSYFDSWPSDTEDSTTVKGDYSDTQGKNYPQLFTDVAYSALNKNITAAREQGLSVMPRLVRAAWRLYDNTYAKYTAPILVYNMGTQHITALEGASTQKEKNIASKLYPYTIDYILGDTQEIIEKWGDIIKGVTFFLGSEVYDYDQNGTVRNLNKTYSTQKNHSEIMGTETDNWVNNYMTGETHYYAELPRISESEQKDKLRNTAPLYKAYDKELSEYQGQYVLLQFKLTRSGENSLAKVKGHTLTINFNTGKSITIAIGTGEKPSGIYEKLKANILLNNLDIEARQMYCSQLRMGKNIVPAEMAIALMSKAQPLSVTSITHECEADEYKTLDVFALNCYGNPLPSEDLPMKSLETQTHINDDYLQHVDLLPDSISCYNQRLDMANLRVKHMGYDLNANVVPYNPVTKTSASGYEVKGIYYYIRTRSGEMIVEANYFHSFADLHYLYFPDSRCYKAVVKAERPTLPGTATGTIVKLVLPMKPSDTLNGAVFIDRIPYNNIITTYSVDNSSGEEKITYNYDFNYHYSVDMVSFEVADKEFPTWAETNKGVERLQNVVLTTMVANPFNWQASGECSVGNSDVLAIVPNTTALSSGQFGQHPIYAFTSEEGVWALSIGNDGQFVAVQPAQRDILVNSKSVCQLDKSVVFATKRGLVEQSGSDVRCVSSELDNDTFDYGSLPNFTMLLDAGNVSVDKLPKVAINFKDYIKGCEMSYDYRNQRILVFNKDYDYAYVYSFKSSSWGTIVNTLDHALNSYPDALCVDRQGNVVDIGTMLTNVDESSSGIVGGLVVTRPFKIDGSDTLKTIYKIYQNGRYKNGNVKQVLYGSRDLVNWSLVSSSSTGRMTDIGGSPYKYFILCLVCSFEKGEKLYAFTLDYGFKYLNRLR